MLKKHENALKKHESDLNAIQKDLDSDIKKAKIHIGLHVTAWIALITQYIK